MAKNKIFKIKVYTSCSKSQLFHRKKIKPEEASKHNHKMTRVLVKDRGRSRHYALRGAFM